MSDPRQLAQRLIDEVEMSEKGLDFYDDEDLREETVEQIALLRDSANALLSALDALEAATRARNEARAGREKWKAAHSVMVEGQKRIIEQRDAAEAALEAANKALREIDSEIGQSPHDETVAIIGEIVRSALAGVAGEPEEPEQQDLGGTAVAVPGSESEKA